MNKKSKTITHIIIPMLIGGFIYILFREDNLLMFNWFNSLGMKNLIDFFQEYTLSKNLIPNWIKFSLPDGIWIYSLTSLMLIIWYKDSNKTKYIWLLIGPILGISAELGQLINIVPGTFDNTDLIFCLIGSITPFIFFNHIKNLQRGEIP